MGIFNKKKRYLKGAMPNLMMVVGMDMVANLQAFNDIDDNYSIAVNLGYYYGFLRLQLSGITSVKTADEIIEKSLDNLKEATENKVPLDNFNLLLRLIITMLLKILKEQAILIT